MKPLPIGPQDALDDLEPCFDGLIQFFCAAHPEVPWTLVKAQIWQESRFNPLAVSPTGPVGLGQFTKATWDDFRPGRDRRDVFYMAGAMVEYMERLLRWGSDRGAVAADVPRFALAAYNAGPGNIVKCQEWASKEGADPMQWGNVRASFPPVLGPLKAVETAGYVHVILDREAHYKV